MLGYRIIRLFKSRWVPPHHRLAVWVPLKFKAQKTAKSAWLIPSHTRVKESKIFPSQIKLEQVGFVHLPCLLQHLSSLPVFLQSASLLRFIMHNVSQGISAMMIKPEKFKRWFGAATVIVVMRVGSFGINTSLVYELLFFSNATKAAF